MEHKYYLPDNRGNKQEYKTESNSVIIVGANGSGKSKLGAWMERQDMKNVHRISAQRKLIFNENISLKSYKQAQALVLYGTDNNIEPCEKRHRWGWKKEYTTTMIDDYENVLASLIALTHTSNAEYVNLCKTAEREGKDNPHTVMSPTDRLLSVWDCIFPHRGLRLNDSKFETILKKDGKETVYSANQMSDGERAVLYLAAEVLSIPAGKTLIIDEPEIHLHRSIMNQLWHALEKCRPDCLFIYITHDTEFASLHSTSDKIWLQEFDGARWTFCKIAEPELPEDLLFNILGSRKNVLFVEGESSSYDTQLYSALYPSYHVIACGSCAQVIARVKAFKQCRLLHTCEVFGIIDRDYRSEHEISKYNTHNIYTLEVAEVENLFIVEELIKIMAGACGEDPDSVFNNVKKYVIEDRFKNDIKKQVRQSVVAYLHYQLSTVNLSNEDDRSVKESLESAFTSLQYDQLKEEKEKEFMDVLEHNEYKQVLRIYNEKSLASTIGRYMLIKNDSYCSKVLRLLRGEKRNAIIAALTPYLPQALKTDTETHLLG